MVKQQPQPFVARVGHGMVAPDWCSFQASLVGEGDMAGECGDLGSIGFTAVPDMPQHPILICFWQDIYTLGPFQRASSGVSAALYGLVG